MASKRSIEERVSSLEKQLAYALNSIRALEPQQEQQELTKHQPTLRLKLKQARKRNDVLSVLKDINRKK